MNPSIKAISFIVALLASATILNAQNETQLWKKVEKAEKEGKPQTATIYLKQLEKIASDRGDELEKFYITEELFACISSFNWKEANVLYPEYSSAKKKLFDNLDANIEKYSGHKREIILLFERAKRHRSEILQKGENARGEDWILLRKEYLGLLANASGTKYESLLKQEIAQLDRKELNSNLPQQTAPGKEVVLQVTARNIGEISVSLYKLDEGILFSGGQGPDVIKNLRKHAELVSSSTFSKLENEFAISEEVEISVLLQKAGNYVVHLSSGDCDEFVPANASDIAGAIRKRSGELEIFAANLTTGKPYDTITATFFTEKPVGSGNGFAFTIGASSRHYIIDGFTPAGIEESQKEDESLRIRLEQPIDHGSPAMSIPYWRKMGTAERNAEHPYSQSFLLTDRTLYKPSDSIFFKVICYSGNGIQGKVSENRPVEVSLRHSSDAKPVSTMNLMTNDFGSASGAFVLPESAKNGTYFLEVKGESSTSVRVESYKRPSFTISFEQPSDIFCFGDIISQKGSVSNYAGFPVAGAKIKYSITRRSYPRAGRYFHLAHDSIASGETISDNEGHFSINFAAKRPADAPEDDFLSASYVISVTASDPQGETHGGSVSIPISDIPIDLNISIDGKEMHENTLIVDKDSVSGYTINATALNGKPVELSGTYCLYYGQRLYRKDTFSGNKQVFMPFADMPSGIYKIKVQARFRGKELSTEQEILLISTADRALPIKTDFFYCPVRTEGSIDFLLGTSEDDLYLNMEILDGHNVLHHEVIHLKNELRHIRLPFLKQYGTAVNVSLLGFRNGRKIEKEYIFTNPQATSASLNLIYLRDRTAPGNKEKLIISSVPESEIALSIFDITTDRFRRNSFAFVPLMPFSGKSTPQTITTTGGLPYIRMTKAMASNVKVAGYNMEAADEVADFRSDFGETIGFFPHLRTGKDTTATVEYTTNGLLGTFRILAMSHTKELLVGNAEASFIVQKPLMVIPNLPLFVREGDNITLKAKIVNLTDKQVKGEARITITDELGNHLTDKDITPRKVTLLSNEQGEVSWNIKIPQARKLDVKITCSAGNISDGEINSIIVEPDEVTITESSSFIFSKGKDFNTCEKELKERFGRYHPVFTRAEYSTLSAVKESLHEAARPEDDNAIEWMNQLYICLTRAKVFNEAADTLFRSQAFARMSELQKSDGGFCWFAGMPSSENTTMYILEKLGQLRELGAISPDGKERKIVADAVKYIDSRIQKCNAVKSPSYFAMIRMMAVRSLWLDIPFCDEAEKGFRAFLEGTSDGWQDISILQKAQLCRTLSRCEATAYGDRSFKKRISTIAASLEDYAVINPSAGCYFPNAVMPFRGLMNNEIYAHSQLMELFSHLGNRKLADALAQWLLLQKHNQAWENSVATADAVHALISGNAKDMRFGAVYCSYTTKLGNVTASSNEIDVQRSFIRVSDGKMLKEGDHLNAGDQIIARYTLKNSENRSFVQMTAMRPAAFYPKDELSFYNWNGFYRDVRESETRYYWELLPEETTTIEERFFVSQEGTFTSGIAQVECMYAKEYRGHTESQTVICD